MIEFWNTITDLYSSEYIKNNALTKSYILEKLFTELNFVPETLAFISYNPVIEILSDHYDVYISDQFKNQVQSSRVSTFNLDNCSAKFDAVIGLDEYLTYFVDEHQQRAQLEKISKITGHWFITTLADYKNSAAFKKNQMTIIEHKNSNVLIEGNIPLVDDKQAWENYYYLIKDHTNLTTLGPYQRRTVYFKQLAKYASDLGSRQYIIQKNALYRGFAKRHWEHIITVGF